MRTSRLALLVFFCIIGIVALSFLHRPGAKPALTENSLSETESPSVSHRSWIPTSASRARAAKKQFAAQQTLELQNLIHAKLSAWHNEPDARAQYGLLQELRALLTDENVAGIVQSLSADDLAGNFGLAALERWLSADPHTAAAWMASRPDITDEQASLVARMLWKDRDEFQSYLDRLPDGNRKEKILYGAAFEMAASDPQQAIAWATQLNSDDAKPILQAAAFQWASADPDAVKKWVEQSPDADQREGLIAAAAKGMAEQHPREAANWLVTSVNDPDLLAEAGQNIIRSWAAREPSATADWIAQFPPGTIRNEALETLMNFWSASNPTAARAWASNLPAGSVSQTALAILNRSNPATAE